MKKYLVDALVILVMAGFLSLINYFEIWNFYTAYSLIPLLISYFLGQYVHHNFKSQKQITE